MDGKPTFNYSSFRGALSTLLSVGPERIRLSVKVASGPGEAVDSQTLQSASPALGIDQKWPYLCLMFGFGLMTMRLVQIYYRWYKYDEPILEERKDKNTSNLDVPHA